jgi:predicted KAP-like P-loop ATPase
MAENEKNLDGVITDQALNDPSKDKFGRDEFSKRIAEILINKQTPDHLTVGIYGKWGEGKTTLVNFVKFYLERDYKDQAVYIDFNPWRYKDEEQLLNSFFKQFAQGVTHKLGQSGKKIAKTLLAYSGLIVALAEPVTGLTMFASMGGIDKVKDYAGKAKNFISDNDFSPAISSLEKSLEDSESLEKQKERISEQLKKTGKKYIVFIDDIDRLDNREIQILFSLLKVTADFDNVIYVLSFDPEIVSIALEKTYSESGLNFLEKIVQVPLHLPKARQTDIFNDLLYPGVNALLESFEFALTSEEGRQITDSMSNGLKDRIGTPRMVKRYLNALNFALPILKDETDIHDVIMIEGLRVCYPDTYQYVFENRNLFISGADLFISEEREKKEAKIIEEYLKEKDESLNRLLESLFPRINESRNAMILDEEEERSQLQRVHQQHYFERYFTYSVHRSDISDRSFSEFLDSLESEELSTSTGKAKEFLSSSNEDVFLRKIEEYQHKISDSEAIKLALVLGTLGEVLTKRDDLIVIQGPIRRAAKVITDVIKKLPRESGLSTAKEVLAASTNILLTAEIGRYLHKSVNKDPLFTDDEHQELVDLVAELIKHDAHEEGAFYLRDDLERSTPLLFNLWTHTSKDGEVEEFIIDSFDNDPDKVMSFLKSFTPLIGGQDEKLYGPFEADEYNKVTRLVPPKVISDLLLTKYSEFMSGKVDLDDYLMTNPVEERLANNFAFYYLRDAQDSKENKSDADG